MSPISISLIAFVLIIAGAFAGMALRNLLPKHHLSDDSKDVIRLGSALIATIAGLVLGLLISSAKSSYDAQTAQVRHITADIVLLDNFLELYGPETRNARELVRRAVGPLADRIWRKNGAVFSRSTPFEATVASERALAAIQELDARTDAQRSYKSRAIQLTTDLGQSRLVLFEQEGASIPLPFLAVLVFWLAIIFASFSLFSRLNPTAIAALFVFAFSAAGAIFLILEMDQPFAGLIQISDLPMRNALAPLGP